MLTAATITDEQIRALLESLERGHYATQWCIDAMAAPSPSHPNRRPNARARCAEIISARGGKAMR